jgi:uncharacterized membrane protein
MKLFGHPVHLMLNHFPAALFPLDAVLYGLYYCTGDMSYMTASFYVVFAGVITGWLSGLTGILDVFKIPKEKEKSLTLGFIHGGLQALIMIAYTVLVVMLYKTYPNFAVASITLLILRCVLVVIMLVGNYLGGNLLIKHKIGIEA